MSDLSNTNLGKFERYLVEEFYDDWREGEINRRTFIRKVAFVTGSMAATTAAMLALGCSNDELPAKDEPMPKAAAPVPTEVPKAAATASPTAAPVLVPVVGAKSKISVPDGDPAVIGSDVKFAAGATQAGGYLAKPAKATPGMKAILVCHENRGLTVHIRDVARRFAKEGYVALAVDLLAREGGTPSRDPDQVPGLLTGAGNERHVADFAAGLKYLGTVEGVDGKRIGMTGYCFGGGISWAAATQIPELKAVVPYYGPAPDLAAVKNIKAAVHGMYGETDTRINAGIEPLRGALAAAGIVNQLTIYPGVGHAFHNDTGTAYGEAQATKAWADTLAWFAKYV
ncbi:MAG: dienelactone hydrolase family protein [Chloroflexi bacterium]|nr:MAG: dienelactone hydrolase family protein [Chloroflexota bacterium]